MATRSIRNRYSKSLEGLNAQGFFGVTGTSVAETTATTLQGFINAAVEGSIAVFDASDNSAEDSAMTAGVEYFIGQIVDGQLKRSTTFTAGTGNLEVTAASFEAPVFQQVVVGSNGTTGDLNIDIVGGLQEFVLRVNELTPATQPFPTSEGRAIVRSPSANDYDVANAIVQDLNGRYDYEQNEDDKAIIAEVLVAGATIAFGDPATVDAAASKGQTRIAVSDDTDLVVGEYIVFAAATNTTGPVYKIIDATTNSGAGFITLDRPLSTDIAATTAITDKAYTAGTTGVGIRITALAEDVVFSVGVSEDLASANITTVQEWLQGSGAPWQVAQMEKETQVFAGETTQNIAFRDEFGRPNSFVDGTADDATVTNQYKLWFLKYKKSTPSMAFANEYQTSFGYIIVGVTDASSSTLADELTTVFGA